MKKSQKKATMAFSFSLGCFSDDGKYFGLFDFEMTKKLSFAELLQIIDLAHEFLGLSHNFNEYEPFDIEETLATFQHMFADAVITIDANVIAYGMMEDITDFVRGLIFSIKKDFIELRSSVDMVKLKNMLCEDECNG